MGVPPWRSAPSPRGGAIRAWGGPARSSIMDPALEEGELREREQSENGEQYHRQRRRVRGIPESEAGLVDVVEEERGRVVGAPARHHDYVVDHPERVDDGVYEDEQRGRHEQREDDPPEEVPARRAFDRRRLGQIGRDRLQGGEV